MAGIPPDNPIPELQRLLHARISDDELRTLCIFVNILYDDLPGGELGTKISSLLLKARQRDSLDMLRRYVAEIRPDLRNPVLALGGVPSGVLTYIDLACKRLLPPPGDADVLRNPETAYVPLQCRASYVAASGEDALAYVRRLFQTKSAVLIVGDYGTGKSFLTQRLFLEQAEAYQSGSAGGETSRPRIPILLPLHRIGVQSKAQLLIRIIEHLHMFGYFSGGRPPGEAERREVENGLEGGKFLCILDGFDEIPLQAFSQDTVADLNKLVTSLIIGDNRVLVTTRPGVLPGVFAPSFVERVPAQLGVGYLMAWEPEHHWRQYVAMCARNRIVFEQGRTEFEDLVLSRPGLRQLTTTPLYCQMLVESRESLGRCATPSVAGLYGMYIDRYFTRVADRSVLSRQLPEGPRQMHYKHDCLAATAVGMLRLNKNRLTPTEIEKSLEAIARKYNNSLLKEFTKLDTLVYSLLVMDAGNTYSFSHKSFYEYYVARKLCEQLTSSNKPYAALEQFPLTREIIAFLADILGEDTTFSARLARAFTVEQPYEALGVYKHQDTLRRNLALLQLERSRKLTGVDLEELDFSGYDFSRHDRPCELVKVQLNGCRMEGATLTGVTLTGSQMRAVKLDHAVLDGADLRDVDLTSAYMNNISCERTQFSGADFTDVRYNTTAICDALRWEAEQSQNIDAEWLARAHALLGCATHVHPQKQ